MNPLRSRIRVRGTVQGVGFRPTVYRVATASGLAGFVRNDGQGVFIEVQGDPEAVGQFPRLLRAQAPALARIQALEIEAVPPALAERGFRILESCDLERGRAPIPADVATCDACVGELLDPADRRYRYPFINCTDCGPRFSIVVDTPYDRPRTTMAAFALCEACRAEYECPSSRRFHAEPTACPACGPRLVLQAGGRTLGAGDEALARSIQLLGEGRIVAVKGLGGFLLAADARHPEAVARLRTRKRRPHKPFALMVRDLAEASRIAEVDPAARDALTSPSHPIVLLQPRARHGLAPAVAPAAATVGVMLPYSGLHHLLLGGPLPALVMTSGNVSDEPIARTDQEAVARLSAVADAFLSHDREIHTRVDDSVLQIVAGRPQPLRRARGFAPNPLPLPSDAPAVLAVGAELKNTVCLTRGRDALLSQHVGDLGELRTFEAFVEVIARLRQLVGVQPMFVAHDLHPDYLSTRWARQSGLTPIAVQHHHAHVASCLAEHERTERVIGVAFDGTGYGPDGAVWGGEFLLADLSRWQRYAHLRPLALAGGEAAIRQPWRVACAALLDAGEPLDILGRMGPRRLEWMRQLLQRPALFPRATSAGRWFDAFSALCGLRDEVSYEGQAAVELEAAAAEQAGRPYPYRFERGDGALSIDLRPAVRAAVADLRRNAGAPEIAARFHETLASIVRQTCVIARHEHGLNCVVLSGGCFQNRRLSEQVQLELAAAGFDVLLHRQVPPNDGGLAYGQAVIAAAWLHQGERAGCALAFRER